MDGLAYEIHWRATQLPTMVEHGGEHPIARPLIDDQAVDLQAVDHQCLSTMPGCCHALSQRPCSADLASVIRMMPAWPIWWLVRAMRQAYGPVPARARAGE